MLIIYTVILVLSSYIFIFSFFHRWIFCDSRAPQSKFVLVLGAGVNTNNELSDILEDRLISTISYSQKYKPECIILSGTKKGDEYNEPVAMYNHLVSKGIQPESLVLDEAGFSTLDSLINLQIYDPIEKIIIISQQFHLIRTLLISRILGIRAFGLRSDNLSFSGHKKAYWYIRELIAIPYNLIRLSMYFLKKTTL